MTNYTKLDDSELIDTLANLTDTYTASFKSPTDSPKQFQLKETIDEIVNEFAKRRFESPWKYHQR